MLDVQQLSVSFGQTQVFKNLSFTVPTDGILAVIGPSGTGKTTLINALTRQIASTGNCLLDGQPIAPRQHHLALVPQDYGLLPWQTVRRNVTLGLRISQHQKLSVTQNEKVNTILQALAIAPLAERYPHALSGGQQQRVALARAFIGTPDLLLLDEAFSALDPVVKRQAYQLFMQQWQQRPVATLLITHDLEEALQLGDQLLVLQNGQGQLRSNPLATVAPLARANKASYYQTLMALRNEVFQTWQS